MFTSENNWYGWQYGDDAPFGHQSGGQEFKTFFSKPTRKCKSFTEELKWAAQSTLDTFPNLKPCIFFSGGVDSEVVLRAFMDVGVTPEVFIMRFERDINIYDVSHAVVICHQLGISYNLIDFNLQKFYENDAEAIAEKAQIDRPRALPQLKFMDYCDGLPIYGASDLSIFREDDDYTRPGNWLVKCWEHDVGWSKYVRKIGRPAIMEWYKWTPQLIAAYMNTEWCSKLVSDEFFGKLGTNSTKMMGYREAYLDLLSRKKMTGFENGSDPMIEEFEKFLINKFHGQPYRNSHVRSFADLKTLLCDL